jgi:hypothetical protein
MHAVVPSPPDHRPAPLTSRAWAMPPEAVYALAAAMLSDLSTRAATTDGRREAGASAEPYDLVRAGER